MLPCHTGGDKGDVGGMKKASGRQTTKRTWAAEYGDNDMYEGSDGV